MQVYGYNVPDNMYLWGSLRRLLKLNSVTWQDTEIESAAVKLLEDVHTGIVTHGIVEVDPGVKAYAYEVDGLGKALVDFDDPNLPSLLAMPLLGYTMYDHITYDVTRQRILNADHNPFYFSGSELHGLGSPHTESDFVWPLATAVDAITTANTTRQLELLGMLLKMSSGNGLVHESVHVDYTARFSRAEFGWANAMSVVMLEHLLGVDCDLEAERFRLNNIAEREGQEAEAPPNGDADSPKYYEQLEAGIIHVGAQAAEAEEEQPSSWKQLLEDQLQQQMQQELLQRVLGVSSPSPPATPQPDQNQQTIVLEQAQQAGQQGAGQPGTSTEYTTALESVQEQAAQSAGQLAQTLAAQAAVVDGSQQQVQPTAGQLYVPAEQAAVQGDAGEPAQRAAEQAGLQGAQTTADPAEALLAPSNMREGAEE